MFQHVKTKNYVPNRIEIVEEYGTDTYKMMFQHKEKKHFIFVTLQETHYSHRLLIQAKKKDETILQDIHCIQNQMQDIVQKHDHFKEAYALGNKVWENEITLG